MARYHLRYTSYADEQLSRLPRSLRTEFDATVEDLARNPYAVGDYDKSTNSYTTTFGGGTGIVLFVASDVIDTVTIIRINWVKW
ncbi:MAG: type II toxin-antitoxin system RelE family toxin [Pseudonocardiaceae bacterium]